jgi:branched-chain amino acid transport system permease protein
MPKLPRARFEVIALVVLLIYPLFPLLDIALHAATGVSVRIDRQLVNVFIFAILALALNMQVGYAGILQLGIAAFFAIGAFGTGILTVEKYPFQIGFWGALVIVPAIAAVAGLALGLPTLRLRGDYLAVVTLGFGEVVRVVLLNLENVTDGPRGLNPIPPPWLPAGMASAGRAQFLTMYYVGLLLLAGLVVLMRVLERSRLGRAFVALREDELAAASMGVRPARIKLIALAGGAAIAGVAGALYATNLTTTAEPDTYDFNYSIMVLCCLIIGGLGSVRGALLGAALLLGFDNIVSPLITRMLQTDDTGHVLLSVTNWRWLIFGGALVLMMRLKPEGLWPATRSELEARPDEERRP